MALNPIAYTEHVVRSFLRYQLTAYPFADDRLHDQMRYLLSPGPATGPGCSAATATPAPAATAGQPRGVRS